MRVSIKLAIIVALVVAVAVTVQSTMHVQQISALQEREIRDDATILARTLAGGSAELWRTSGEDAARAFVRLSDQRRELATIQLVAAGSEAALGPSVERIARQGRWRVLARQPVVVSGETVGVVVVDRALPAEQEYAAATLQSQVVMTSVAALLAAGVVVAAVLVLVAAPLRQLTAHAHRVAGGDYSRLGGRFRGDEVGDLARELDAMTERLAEARNAIKAARSARAAAVEQLRHADRLSTVGKLAASVAHELGTPLNVASGRASLIASDPSASEAVLEHTRIIREQSERMAGIIRELLDFARQGLRRRRMPVHDLLVEAADLVEPLCDGADVVLSVEAEEGLHIDVDGGKALQVLTNLMVNAVHAMPDGGTLTVSAAKEVVAEPPERHADAGGFVRVDVEDTGVGMAADQLARIFDPFFTTKRAGRGTGLGLGIAQGIVHEHGGFIRVQSETHVGTTFSVYFPERSDA